MKHDHTHEVVLPEELTQGVARLQQHFEDHREAYFSAIASSVLTALFMKLRQKPMTVNVVNTIEPPIGPVYVKVD